MQAYRLEMGCKLSNSRGDNLYQFWGDIITSELNQALQDNNDDVLVNLASTEYFKSVKTPLLKATVVTPIFKDWKNGQYKIISFFAKKARGLMARYIIQHKLTEVDDIKQFDLGGYQYEPAMSKGNEWVFTRKEA
jgi:hypothetical protein